MFQTYRYKQGFIHVSIWDRHSAEEVRYQLEQSPGVIYSARSVLAAKQAITRRTRQHPRLAS